MRCSLCLFQLIALLLACLPAMGQTNLSWPELRDRYVRAMGGFQRLQAMKSVAVRAKITDAAGNESTLQVWKARPNRVRTVLIRPGGLRLTQGFDGVTAWQRIEQPGRDRVQEMDSQVARAFIRHAPIESPLVSAASGQLELQYHGLEPVYGTQAHRVTVHFSDNASIDFWIDPDTYVERCYTTREWLQGEPVVTESFPSDYRMVEGVLFAFRTVERDASDQRIIVEIESVRINPGMMDALFSMPQAASQNSIEGR